MPLAGVAPRTFYRLLRKIPPPLISTAMRFALLIALLLAVGAVLFAMQNTDPIDIEGFGYRLTSNESVVILTTLLTGVLIGYLASAPATLGARRRARQAEKRLGEVEAARSEASAARAAARSERGVTSAPADYDAAETQRLADEVARRTADATRPPPSSSL